jgi:methylglutaconyl-CoA hydratase
MAEELISELADNGVLTITMNRPEVHNAFDDAQIARLTEAFKLAAANDAARVVVVTGAGKSFSAGADLNYMRRMGTYSHDENIADAGLLADMLKTLNFMPKPTVARVKGAAMGGGVGLTCCCDFAIGTAATRFALSEVKLGLTPATISPYVVRTLGERNARRLILSGQPVLGQQALQLGLLDHAVDEDQLDTAVEALCSTLLKNSPNAMKVSKELVFRVSEGDIDQDMIDYTIKCIADVRDSDEGREGTSAFLEKRSPSWISTTGE